jgi:hypothetical protein
MGRKRKKGRIALVVLAIVILAIIAFETSLDVRNSRKAVQAADALDFFQIESAQIGALQNALNAFNNVMANWSNINELRQYSTEFQVQCGNNFYYFKTIVGDPKGSTYDGMLLTVFNDLNQFANYLAAAIDQSLSMKDQGSVYEFINSRMYLFQNARNIFDRLNFDLHRQASVKVLHVNWYATDLSPTFLQSWITSIESSSFSYGVVVLKIVAWQISPEPISFNSNVAKLIPTNNITVTVVVSNSGDSVATNVGLTLNLNNGTFNESYSKTISNITPGGSIALVFPNVSVSPGDSYTIAATIPSSGSVTGDFKQAEITVASSSN